MNCQECELILASEHPELAEEHLERCESCRVLVEDLRANTEAFRSFQDDDLPPFRPVAARPWRRRWALAASFAAAAAALMLTFLMLDLRRALPISRSPAHVAIEPPDSELPRNAGRSSEQPRLTPKQPHSNKKASPRLTVKMLTPDPDVVIYWIVEPKEGTQE